MDDLISRQAAIMHFVKVSKNYECGMFDLKEVTHELWQLPSAQPEIIHCRECKYSSDDEYCHCSYTTWWNNPDDFCSRAERREE